MSGHAIDRTTAAIAAAVVAAATIAGATTVSCMGPGNTGQTPLDPSLGQAVPWTNGYLDPVDDAGSPDMPDGPVYPPIATGLPDPGSRPADCSGLAGIQTSPAWIANFESDNDNDPTRMGVAVAWTGFDDLTPGSFHAPGDVNWYPGLSGTNSALYGIAAEPTGGPSCDGAPNKWSLHFRGGQFRNWGGGVSTVFTDSFFAGCPADADICPAAPAPGATVDSAGLPLTAPDGGPYAQSHAFIDVSAYEGVAFWARRGPEGQDRMIVTITDNFTSDRLARQNQKYCRRLHACYTQCPNGAPCTLVPNDPTSYHDPANPTTATMGIPTYRCIVPSDDAGALLGPPTNDALVELLYPRCGQSACTSRQNYMDWDFQNTQCQPYTFPAADISREYCFNPGDPPPPDRDDQCLDGWATTVELTTDWQFYTVKFSDMQQGGFGKKAPYFNLKAVDTIAFGFIVGWADAFIDNVTFYRRTN
jgi:hypothetical protein